MWAITKAKSLSCKIQITTASGKYLPQGKRNVDTLNHIPFGGTCRKPGNEDVVVPTIGHLLLFYFSVLSTGKFPERY